MLWETLSKSILNPTWRSNILLQGLFPMLKGVLPYQLVGFGEQVNPKAHSAVHSIIFCCKYSGLSYCAIGYDSTYTRGSPKLRLCLLFGPDSPRSPK